MVNQELPKHVAIIPDGNRRWAKERGLPPLIGHKMGMEAAGKLLKSAKELKIHTLTLWAFSTENWRRSQTEVSYLMQIFTQAVDKYLPEIKKAQARLIHLGRKDRIPAVLANKISKLEAETKNNHKHILNLAIDYGGHDEILRAVERAFVDLQKKKITIKKLAKQTGLYQQKYPYFFFNKYFDTGDQPYPYPDLIIRTSGEQRLSGFLPWQAVYSELYFEPSHFPDFTPEKFRQAIAEYQRRKRRFGGN